MDGRDPSRPYFLAPADLQAIKACGVTFVHSMLERVIESTAGGGPDAAAATRATIEAEVGQNMEACFKRDLVMKARPKRRRGRSPLLRWGCFSRETLTSRHRRE